MTDQELEKIYSEAYRAVYWTAMSLLKNEEEAEDIVQDTFVTLIESYDTLKDKSKVTAWLKKIAANKSLNRLTRTKTVAVDDEFLEDVETVPEDFLPDSIVESDAMRRIVMDIIEKSLSDEIRRTLILFYFDEMTTREIAETLGVPEGTVRRRLNFARNKIKKEVEKYEDENETKLFAMAPLPFLSKLFMKEAEQVPFKAMPASLTTTLSASAKVTAKGAATRTAASAAKKGTGIMINKFLLGGIAAVVIIGITTAGIIYYLQNKNNNEKTKPKKISSVQDSEPIDQDDPDQSKGSSDREKDSDGTGVLTPDAAVLMKSPVVNGYPINVPCTIGDLKEKGFSIEEVVDGEMVCMAYDEADNYYAFNCILKDPVQDESRVSDDTQVIAIQLFIIGTDLDFYDVELGMSESDFAAVIGTPYYLAGRSVDHGRYYYFLGLGDLVYEFYCSELTEDPGHPQLISIVFGTQEYMYKNTRLSDVI